MKCTKCGEKISDIVGDIRIIEPGDCVCKGDKMTDRQKVEAIIENGSCKGIIPSCKECPLKKGTCFTRANIVEQAKRFLDNEWTELDVTNLPPNILVGDYEFQYLSKNGTWCQSQIDRHNVLQFAVNGNKFRYRKAKKELNVEELAKEYTPTHEKIMNSRWKTDYGEIKVIASFGEVDKEYLIPKIAHAGFKRVNAAWFIGRESADIPKE